MESSFAALVSPTTSTSEPVIILNLNSSQPRTLDYTVLMCNSLNIAHSTYKDSILWTGGDINL